MDIELKISQARGLVTVTTWSGIELRGYIQRDGKVFESQSRRFFWIYLERCGGLRTIDLSVVKDIVKS